MINEQSLKFVKPWPVEALEAVPLEPGNGEWLVYVGSQLEDVEKKEIIGCLKSYANIFAWSPTDMPRIDPHIITHHLNVPPGVHPIK